MLGGLSGCWCTSFRDSLSETGGEQAVEQVQQKDEVKHRDWCIEEFAENKKQTVLNQDTMEDLQAPKDRLPKKLAGLQPAAALCPRGAARYGLVYVRSVRCEQ